MADGYINILVDGGLPDTDREGNEIYPDFRNMIRLETVLHDDTINPATKMLQAVQLLYGENIPDDLGFAYGELIWFYHGGADQEGGKGKSRAKHPRLWDFEEDAECVYAAFRQAYDIDISCEGLALHWWEFRALFLNLPENTQMARRLYYRSVDTSKLKGDHKAEVEEKKKLFALKTKRPTVARTLEEIEAETKRRMAERFAQAEAALKQKEGE